MPNSQVSEDDLDFAKRKGTPLLAHFPNRVGWHFVIWSAPNSSYYEHWCIEGQWTPETPDAFLLMPQEPS